MRVVPVRAFVCMYLCVCVCVKSNFRKTKIFYLNKAKNMTKTKSLKQNHLGN